MFCLFIGEGLLSVYVYLVKIIGSVFGFFQFFLIVYVFWFQYSQEIMIYFFFSNISRDMYVDGLN